LIGDNSRYDCCQKSKEAQAKKIKKYAIGRHTTNGGRNLPWVWKGTQGRQGKSACANRG